MIAVSAALVVVSLRVIVLVVRIGVRISFRVCQHSDLAFQAVESLLRHLLDLLTLVAAVAAVSRLVSTLQTHLLERQLLVCAQTLVLVIVIIAIFNSCRCPTGRGGRDVEAPGLLRNPHPRRALAPDGGLQLAGRKVD